MNTKWNMAFFLFFALIGVAILILNTFAHRNRYNRVLMGVTMITVVVAASSIILNLGNPAKVINILAKPAVGISSAILSQLLIFITALILLVKCEKTFNKTLAVSALSMAAIFLTSRIYMVTTRPALNGYILTLLLICVVVWLGLSLRDKPIYFAISIFYNIILAIFIVRIFMLTPPDRVLHPAALLNGVYFKIFLAILATSLTPMLISIYCYMRKKTAPFVINFTLSTTHLFLISVLLNQMPIIEKGINNRIFF